MHELDHLVLAADTLGRGCEYASDVLGVQPVGGGRHARMGTHNRLIRLDGNRYLEVIAIDPQGDAPFLPRWFGLDEPAVQAQLKLRPRLLTWVARTHDLATAAAQLPSPSEAHAMQRGDLHWTFLFSSSGALYAGGVLPHFIQWPAGSVHPVSRMPDGGCSLHGLRGFHPDAVAINATLGAMGLSKTLVVRKPGPQEPVRLQAMIQTPARGMVVFE